MSIQRYAVYDAKGAIKRIVTCSEPVRLLQAGVGEDVVLLTENLDDVTGYVGFLPVRVMAKTVITTSHDATTIAADGIDTATLSGIPPGVTVTWPDGVTDEVLDGVVEFAVDLPGVYKLSFDGVRYLKKEVVIEAYATD